MNFFNKNFLFKIAEKKDLKKLMNFIKINGKKNHILAYDSNFFKYESKAVLDPIASPSGFLWGIITIVFSFDNKPLIFFICF